MRSLEKLFTRGWIGGMELKNRLVMPAMDTQYADEHPNQRLIDYYVERAKGGIGLIIVEMAYTEPMGKESDVTLSLASDKYIFEFKKLVDSLHQYGAKVGIQILHAGGHARSSVIGAQPVSASAILCRATKETPRELSVSEIRGCVQNYARAVRRATEAGFDTVEFNCASAYLIRDFLSPTTNQRTDEYGGDLENRMRFLIEIVKATRKKVGQDFPLLCRISADEFIPGGNTLSETRVLARALEKAGVSALSVTPAGHETTLPLTPGYVPHGAFLYLSQAIKGEVKIPVVTSHSFNDPFLAERALQNGKADFVAVGRALLADPEFPTKAQQGRFDEIRRCVRCLQGCYDRVFADEPITCTVNPALGRERELQIKPAQRRKRVMVVGGGPAGMQAAETLAQAGHEVSLYEREERLGGQLNYASLPPGKGEFQNITRYLSHRLEQLGVVVHLGREVRPELVEKERPEAVIIATGATPLTPEIPGVERDKVVTALQVLSEEVAVGQKVVVVGGGMTGCETALTLAQSGALDAETLLFLTSWRALDFETALSLARQGREVTILEALPAIGRDFGRSKRWIVRRLLRDFGVQVVTEAKVERITGSGVEFTKDESRRTIEADTVVLATGAGSDSQLYEELTGKVPELHVIGDGKEPRKALEAIQEGAAVGREI